MEYGTQSRYGELHIHSTQYKQWKCFQQIPTDTKIKGAVEYLTTIMPMCYIYIDKIFILKEYTNPRFY